MLIIYDLDGLTSNPIAVKAEITCDKLDLEKFLA